MPGDELATRLRAARERAGLGVRELASLLGVSPATISQAEAGGDPRRSTLLRYLEVLPSLRPSDLVGAGAPSPPLHSPAAWQLVRDVHGWSAQRFVLTVEVGPDGRRGHLRLVGARPTQGSLTDDVVRQRLLRTLFRGSPHLRTEIAAEPGDLKARSRRLDDHGFRHELRFPRELQSQGIEYRRQQLGDDLPPGYSTPGSLVVSALMAEGASLAIDFPVESFEVVVEFAADVPFPEHARVRAWSDLQAAQAEVSDLLPFLHPEGVKVRRSAAKRRLSMVVERPPCGLYYGLGWGGGDVAESGVPTVVGPWPEEGVDAAQAVQAAREDQGWSRRELARKLDVSPVTVTRLEEGTDVRRSILDGCLEVLPRLQPEQLLPVRPGEGPFNRLDAWEHQRDLLGIESELERKTLVITAAGDAHALCESLGVRRVRPGGSPFRIRYGSARAASKRLPTVLKTVEDAVARQADESGLRVRIIARPQGRLVHEITVPPELAAVGASYTRRLFTPGFFDPDASDDRPTRWDGAAIVPTFAVQRLELVVQLPPGVRFGDVVFGVHPRILIDGPFAEGDVSERLHPEGMRVVEDRKERMLRLEVKHPLVGFLYDVFWETQGT
ncbi:MAG: helix-turn-helix transcriptional regulator [Acidobacteriota bacterium]